MVVAVVTEKRVLRMLVLGAVLRIRAMIVISKLVSIPFLNFFHRTVYLRRGLLSHRGIGV